MDQDQSPGSLPSTSCVTHGSRRTDNQEDLGNIAAEVAKIYNVDQQDSLQALGMQRQNRTAPATTEFISLEELLRTQAEPAPGQEIVDMILRDFCSSPTYEEEEDLSTCESPPWFRFRKKKIKTYGRKRVAAQQNALSVAIEVDDEEEDDRLSCSSGLSVQEDHTAPTATSVRELDANTSQKICENLLNLSQYFSLSNPSSNSNPSKEIDLPTKVIPDPPKPSCSRDQRSHLSDTNSSAECTSIELENLETDLLGMGFIFEASEICDIKPQGNLGDTLFGDAKASTTIVQTQSESKACAEWSEGDSLLENYNTEKMSLSDEELKEKPLLIDQVKKKPIGVKSEHPASCTQSLLDDIPISEWQTPMDIPEESIKETPELNQKDIKIEASENRTEQETVEASTSKCISDAEFLQEFPLDEWQPIEQIPEFVGFRTASDKAIVISEEMQEKAAKLLADIEEIEPKPPSDRPPESSEFVGFRTASNKPIEISEEMQEKAAKLLADIGEIEPKTTSDIPTESSEFVGFRTASNKPIEITEEMASKGAMFIAQFKANDLQSQSNDAELLQDIAFSEWEPIDMPEKTINATTKKQLSQLININNSEPPETKTPNKSQSLNIPQLVAFRKTPYKFMEVAEEMKIKGEKLMAEVESGLYQPSQRRNLQNAEVLSVRESERPNEVSEVSMSKIQAADVKEVEFVGFRTASDKAIVVSEEMKIKAAQFMAEFQTGGGSIHQDSNSNEFIDKPLERRTDKLIAEVEFSCSNQQMEEAAGSAKTEADLVGFRTASNKAIIISEAMKDKAAKFMAEFKAERPINISLNPENQACNTSDAPECFEFRTASNKRIEISEEMKNKAAKLMSEVQAESEANENQKPTSDNECPSDISDNASGESFKGFPENEVPSLFAEENLYNDSVFPRLSQTPKNDCEKDSTVSTPKQRRDTSDGIPSSNRLRKTSNSSPEQKEANRNVHKTTSCYSAFETPIQSQEIHASLSQLAGLSPLDHKTKTSVIARRNLLTLSKRRKRSRTPTGTPLKSRLAAMPASTSTPLADRNTNHVQDSAATKQNADEDMSPICMPPNKSRRLGLSRSRN